MPLLPLFAQPFKRLSLPVENSFKSQTIIITGSNTGLGLEAARHIVSLGASRVILGVRTVAKGEAAKVNIEASTRTSCIIEVWPLDLESFASVKAFASRAETLNRLDTAIMNAGLASGQWNITSDGWERTLQVNVLSTALLSLLLLPLLVRTRKLYPEGRPHLVILGSDVHLDARFIEREEPNTLQALNDKSKWDMSSQKDPAERYAVSKLLDFYLATQLAHLTPSILGDPAVVVNILAPGFCKSELLSREPGAPWALILIQALTARTVADGSKTIVDAAVRGVETHGKYLDHQKISNPGLLVTSEEGIKTMQKVWSEIINILQKVSPEVSDIASGKI